MATFFVSPSGSNASPGTFDEPFGTIQEGIDHLAAPGDVLLLRAGSYAEDVRVVRKKGSEEAPIAIRPYDREQVTISTAVNPGTLMAKRPGFGWRGTRSGNRPRTLRPTKMSMSPPGPFRWSVSRTTSGTAPFWTESRTRV